jgi:hypothetical protein
MSSTLRVTVDPTGVSLAETIASAARHVPFLVLTSRLFNDLAAELGGEEAAARHLARVATDTGRPIAINVETGEGASTTIMISPKGWTSDRLKGWTAGHHEALGELFGEATLREGI